MNGSVFFVIGLLLLSSIPVAGLIDETPTKEQHLSLLFHEPLLTDDGNTISVQMQGAPACVYQSGYPVVPRYTTTLELPFGSIITHVTLLFDDVQTVTIQKKITPAPYPVIGGVCSHPQDVSTDSNIYRSTEFYPAEWCTYTTGGGLNANGTHVTFCTLQVYPLRYSPGTDTLQYLTSCDLTVTYQPATQSFFPTIVTNNLVIITPALFAGPLKRLADHKNNLGIRTQIVTLRDIYRDYPGYDRPEQIKYFIKYAVEHWGTTYVLLVGGLKSHFIGKPRDDLNTGTRDWYLPVRYTNLWDLNQPYDPGFISDLYYADIYDGSGGFCSWDSADDGVYGGWENPSVLPVFGAPNYQTDQIDFYPDVYLGRLPCRNILEVKNMVRKIIEYETNPADQSWFKKMVVVGGDPYDDQGTAYPEGEFIGEKVLSNMPGFDQVKLFASNQATNPLFTPITSNIVREINAGCGFLLFDGHGGPYWWNTFWPGDFHALIENGGISIYQFPRLTNRNMLPVCVVGGCHNNLFNVTFVLSLLDRSNTHFMWTNGVPTPDCWGWSLTVKRSGGAIATIGNTGLGYEAGGEVGDLNGDTINEPDCVEALCGYLETQFFKDYGVHHVTVLGNLWSNAIGEYLNIYPGMENRSDAKTVEQWVLFGDPTLQVGGYS
jgi:hypothetical protein